MQKNNWVQKPVSESQKNSFTLAGQFSWCFCSFCFQISERKAKLDTSQGEYLFKYLNSDFEYPFHWTLQFTGNADNTDKENVWDEQSYCLTQITSNHLRELSWSQFTACGLLLECVARCNSTVNHAESLLAHCSGTLCGNCKHKRVQRTVGWSECTKLLKKAALASWEKLIFFLDKHWLINRGNRSACTSVERESAVARAVMTGILDLIKSLCVKIEQSLLLSRRKKKQEWRQSSERDRMLRGRYSSSSCAPKSRGCLQTQSSSRQEVAVSLESSPISTLTSLTWFWCTHVSACDAAQKSDQVWNHHTAQSCGARSRSCAHRMIPSNPSPRYSFIQTHPCLPNNFGNSSPSLWISAAPKNQQDSTCLAIWKTQIRVSESVSVYVEKCVCSCRTISRRTTSWLPQTLRLSESCSSQCWLSKCHAVKCTWLDGLFWGLAPSPVCLTHNTVSSRPPQKCPVLKSCLTGKLDWNVEAHLVWRVSESALHFHRSPLEKKKNNLGMVTNASLNLTSLNEVIWKSRFVGQATNNEKVSLRVIPFKIQQIACDESWQVVSAVECGQNLPWQPESHFAVFCQSGVCTINLKDRQSWQHIFMLSLNILMRNKVQRVHPVPSFLRKWMLHDAESAWSEFLSPCVCVVLWLPATQCDSAGDGLDPGCTVHVGGVWVGGGCRACGSLGTFFLL